MIRRALLPILLAAVLAADAVAGGTDAAAPAPAGPRVVDVTARRFQFTPGTITLKKDEPVILRLRSEDVVHGFFQKPLGIDAIIEPGKVTEVRITPREAGRYVVICHHFCGSGHGGMKLTLVVE